MSGHRFQILLDDERYERVTSLARDRKVSVAALAGRPFGLYERA